MDNIAKAQTAFEMNSEMRAIDLFERDPEAALAGSKLISLETDPSFDRSLAITELALNRPERFLELVSYLPHAIQDIFFQYYLLGRTQTQIAKLVGSTQTNIWQAIKAGLGAICAVLSTNGLPTRKDPMWLEYEKVLQFAEKMSHRSMLKIAEPKILGSFTLPITEEEFEQCFAPMTTDGPLHRGSGC